MQFHVSTQWELPSRQVGTHPGTTQKAAEFSAATVALQAHAAEFEEAVRPRGRVQALGGTRGLCTFTCISKT